MSTAASIFAFILTAIGAVASLWFLYEKFVPYRRITWRRAEKLVDRMVEEMISDGFVPSFIVGIGRGGAILGALMAGRLGHRPILAITADHHWGGGGRRDDLAINFSINEPDWLEHVLLVAGETHTGQSMRLVESYLASIGCTEVRRAVLYYERGTTQDVEYVGFRTTRKMVRLPWMYTRHYQRLARGEVMVTSHDRG